jgi:hypothetical protein
VHFASAPEVHILYDRSLRNRYYKVKKEYRKLKKISKRKFEETSIKALEENSGNYIEFWKKLKQIRNKNNE